MRLALRFRRRRCRSMTASANAIPIRYRSARSTEFSKRERRLRGQPLTLHRIATAEHLLDRIRSQPARIVRIRVAAADRIQALAHQITDRVADLTRLASLINRADQRLGQTQPPVARLQQDRSAIGTGVLLVKFSDDRLVEKIRKQNTLSCAIVIHAKASFMLRNTCGKAFLARSRPLHFSISNRFANSVG